MTDRRRPSPQQSGQEDNPFAPPPEDLPDQPWRPRQPHHGAAADEDGNDTNGGDGEDGGNGGANGHGGSDGDGTPENGGQPAPWGSQWSSRQPSRHHGGEFGQRPGRREGGQSGRGRHRGGPRWDPSDPAQRRARFALLGGMWGLFFALFDITSVALLLGALSLYWGTDALRRKSRDGATAQRSGASSPRPAGDTADARGNGRVPQRGPAVMGLVTGGLAVAIVAVTFATQLVYQDYFHCVDDALTGPARENCERLLPEQVRPLLEGRG